MGLEHTHNNRTFLNIKKGKIVKRITQSQVEEYGALSGVLSDLYIKDGKYGPELHLCIEDMNDCFDLQLKLDSGYARGFMRSIKNVNLSDTIQLRPKYIIKDGKETAAMYINQYSKGVDWFYTEETPNGLPALESIKIRNHQGIITDGWDNSKQLDFFQRMLLEDIRPKLKGYVDSNPVHQPSQTTATPTNQAGVDTASFDDDLPF